MSDDTIGRYRLYTGFSKSTLMISSLVISASMIMAVFSATAFEAKCICTINYLAYSWIAFAITALLALVTWITAVCAENSTCTCRRHTLLSVMISLQGLAFVAALIFMLIFVTRYTEVI